MSNDQIVTAAGVQGYSVPMEKTVIFSSHLSADEVLALIPSAIPLIGYYNGKLELSYAATPDALGWDRRPNVPRSTARWVHWLAVSEHQKCWIRLDESIACNHRPAHMIQNDDDCTSEYIGDWVSRPRDWCINQDYTMNPATGDYWVIEKPAFNSPAAAFQDYAMRCIEFTERLADQRYFDAQQVVDAKHPLAQIQIDSNRRASA